MATAICIHLKDPLFSSSYSPTSKFHPPPSPKPTNPTFSFPNTHLQKPNKTPFFITHLTSSNSETQFTEHPKTENSTQDTFQTQRFNCFLDESDLKNLELLGNFNYVRELGCGFLKIRVMKEEEMEKTVDLLSESFSERQWAPSVYVNLLKVIMMQHLKERRNVLPNAVTLVGFWGEEGEGGDEIMELVATVELFFNARGASERPLTPTPPRDSPYLCNMTVKREFRRRGIGGHLLKAAEELVPKIGLNEIYLHCRLVDTVPLNMYKRTGYKVVQTDNILTLLSLQRRKHLMYKKLPPCTCDSLEHSDPKDPCL